MHTPDHNYHCGQYQGHIKTELHIHSSLQWTPLTFEWHIYILYIMYRCNQVNLGMNLHTAVVLWLACLENTHGNYSPRIPQPTKSRIAVINIHCMINIYDDSWPDHITIGHTVEDWVQIWLTLNFSSHSKTSYPTVHNSWNKTLLWIIWDHWKLMTYGSSLCALPASKPFQGKASYYVTTIQALIIN